MRKRESSKRRKGVRRLLLGDPYGVLQPGESVMAEARTPWKDSLYPGSEFGCLIMPLLFLGYLIPAMIGRLAGQPVVLGQRWIVTDRRLVVVEDFRRTRAAELSAIRSVDWGRTGRWYESGGEVTVDVVGSRGPWRFGNLKEPWSLATAIEEQIRLTRRENGASDVHWE